MKTLQELRQLLVDRRLQVVADEAGVHFNTLRTIRDDPKANPTYRVIKALSEYFEAQK